MNTFFENTPAQIVSCFNKIVLELKSILLFADIEKMFGFVKVINVICL